MDNLTPEENLQIQVQQALFELKIMGDRFAASNIKIVKDYITNLEKEIERLKNEQI